MSWMTQAEAATALNCSIRTVRRRIRSRTLEARRDGRHILVKVDPEDAAPSISPLTRRWTELDNGGTARSENVESIAAVATSAKEAISTLAEFREALETDINRVRLARRRAGWVITSALVIALGVMAWFYHERGISHMNEIHELRQGLAEAEARGRERVATTEARKDGETDALWTSLTFARSRVEELQERNSLLAGKLATAVDQRERTAREKERLEARARVAERAADFVGTLKSVASTVGVVALRMWSMEDQERATEEAAEAELRHRAELLEARARYDSQLASAKGRFEGETAELRTALEYERQSVAHLENRVDALSDRLVDIATDRGRIRLEKVRLAAEVDRLQEELERARQAADVADAFRKVWSVLHVGFAGADAAPEDDRVTVSTGRYGPPIR